MPKFKVGDEVVMSQYGKRHTCGNGPNGSNPWGVRGVVDEVSRHGNLPIYVCWDNGRGNTYAHEDLDYFNLKLENK